MVASPRAQQTLAREARVSGIGFLTGADVSLTFLPAPADSGVRFRRVDLPGEPEVAATIDNVVPRGRRTAIQSGPATVEMVEHVMAALYGLHIDNCVVLIDASETPGCDGSSLMFVEALAGAGLSEQASLRETAVIDRPITVRDGAAVLTAHPGESNGLVLAYNLDYGAGSPIGRQSHFVRLSPEVFRGEIAASRTFLLESEATALRSAGVGARTTYRDLLIFGPDGLIDNELRYPDECVRHKILDMVGDLALLGKDIVGNVVAFRSGHSLNAELVRGIRSSLSPVEASHVAVPFDINAIMRALPHRYPFLLVDRVLELVPESHITAIKNVSCNEPFFTGHWPNRPIMPGVLIIEALAQAAGVMFARRPSNAKRLAYIVAIDEAKIRRSVVPGDRLVLEVRSLKSKERTEIVYGRALVDGRQAAEARIRFMFVDDREAA